MTIRGSTAWHRRNDPKGMTPEETCVVARANGMFYEPGERLAFERWFADSRRGKGADYAARELLKRADGSYHSDSTQRHWWTWCCALGGGQPLPKFDPYKLAADRLEALGSTAL